MNKPYNQETLTGDTVSASRYQERNYFGHPRYTTFGRRFQQKSNYKNSQRIDQ
jgi:hypothetical protein